MLLLLLLPMYLGEERPRLFGDCMGDDGRGGAEAEGEVGENFFEGRTLKSNPADSVSEGGGGCDVYIEGELSIS